MNIERGLEIEKPNYYEVIKIDRIKCYGCGYDQGVDVNYGEALKIVQDHRESCDRSENMAVIENRRRTCEVIYGV